MRRGCLGIAVTGLLALAWSVPPGLALAQVARPDATRPAFDPEAPPETRYRVAPALTFGAEIELEYEFARNLDLREAGAASQSGLTPELSLAFSFDPNTHVQAFLNLEASGELVLGGGEGESQAVLELKEAFVWLKRLAGGPLSLQVGRQRFNDAREWLYDEELDAVRVWSAHEAFGLELSVSRNGLVRKDLLTDEGKERINNYLLLGRYQLAKDVEIAAYGLVRDDRSSARARPVFLGVRSSGEIIEDLDYWLELAHVRGRDGSTRIRGYGVDVGATYEFPLPLKPSVTLGYAFGTGDGNPDDGVDRRFRQTGLQENEDKFNGVTSFKYYGELFDPELSNLSILTLGVGIRPSRRSSVDLVYHHYVQHKASTSLGSSSLEAEPTGRSRRLGSELDLVLGYEEIRDVDAKVVVGWFLPGEAFRAGAGHALFIMVELQYQF